MIITDLPQEILDEIVEIFVRHAGRIANLTSCALTCKAFLSPCQRHLFSTIRLLANEAIQQNRIKEFASIIQRPSCPIGTYVRQLQMYFGGPTQTKTNMDIVFPAILPLLSRVQILTVDISAGLKLEVIEKVLRNCVCDSALSNEAFTQFLGSPSLTTLVISNIGFPGLLGKCTHVKNVSVWSISDFVFKTLNPELRPQIDGLSCGVSLATVRYLIPDFCMEKEGAGKVPTSMVDLSALRRLTLSPEYKDPKDITQHLINYVADTLEDLDCGGVIFLSPKLKPMPCLRTIKRWIHLPTDGPPERTLNQLCDVLAHCTTTSKVIQRITINLVVVQMGFEELIHLDWFNVDDIFESPPPMLKEFTLGIKYKAKPLQSTPVQHEDMQSALKSVKEQRMPHLAKMASAGPDVFKFSFIALK